MITCNIITISKSLTFIKCFAGGSGVRLYDGSVLKLSILVGWVVAISSVAWFAWDHPMVFFSFSLSVMMFHIPVIYRSHLSSPRLCFVILYKTIILFYRDESWLHVSHEPNSKIMFYTTLETEGELGPVKPI